MLDESPEILAEYYHLNYYFPAILKLLPNHFTRQMSIAEAAAEDMVFGSRRQSGMNLAGNMPLKLAVD